MGSPRADNEQVAVVIERLREEYPDTTIDLQFSTRLELLIAVILSAQTPDERVNAVTTDLFEKYDGPADYVAADQDELASDIDSVPYYNNKARYIQGTCERVLEDHDGAVPDSMSALTDLPGVGRKTANVVLQHAYDHTDGVAVDTHVQRLTRRLGITEKTRPEAIERDLLPLVAPKDRKEFTHLLIDHGRAVCTARTPDCDDCVLEDVCPSSKLDSDVDLASGEAWE